MPFTLAHPLVVVPLRRLGLPLSALVAGAMVPDVPLYVPTPFAYATTHEWTGVLTLDVLLTLVAVAAWTYVVRDALVDLSPATVRERLAPHDRYGRRSWLLAPVAAVAGSASHVVWDDFTHHDRWGVDRIAWLHTQHGPLMGYHWAQYVSSWVGVLALVAWGGLALRRLPRHPRARRVPWLGSRALAGAAVGVVVAVALATAPRLSSGAHAVAYRGATSTVLAGVAAVVLLTAAWHVLSRRGAPESGAQGSTQETPRADARAG